MIVLDAGAICPFKVYDQNTISHLEPRRTILKNRFHLFLLSSVFEIKLWKPVSSPLLVLKHHISRVKFDKDQSSLIDYVQRFPLRIIKIKQSNVWFCFYFER